jgi:Domain of unknown function (DUF4261)
MSILLAELWYDVPPTLDRRSLLDEVRRSHPDADPLPDKPESPFMIAFPSLAYRLSDGVACLLIAIEEPRPRSDAESPRDLSQTWTWQQAATTLASTTHTLQVNDLMGRLLPPQPRVCAFRAVVDAIVTQTRPVGTWWPLSQVALSCDAAVPSALAGLVNVRLFKDAGHPDNLLMDTLGLHTLGLPDAQVYFRDLEVGRVAGLLLGLADYIFSGVEIEPGHTVEGLETDQRWRVSHEQATVGPDRLVLSLDTGPDRRPRHDHPA